MSAALNSAGQTFSLLLRTQKVQWMPSQSQDIFDDIVSGIWFVMFYAFLGQKACQLTNFGYDSTYTTDNVGQ